MADNPSPTQEVERRLKIWICPECGERVGDNYEPPMLPARGHYHDNPKGRFLKRIFHPAVEVEVMPVEDHQRLLLAVEEERDEWRGKEIAALDGRKAAESQLLAEEQKRGEVEAERNKLQSEAEGTHDLLAHFRDERRRLESRLSAVEAELEEKIGAASLLYEAAKRANDRDGQVVHGVTRDTLLEIRQLLRDKGTEQGASR